MGLEESARAELLAMRKHTDGVTVGALAGSPALCQVLGGGDPRVAYNALKHSVLSLGDSLAVTAACYSLGFASEGATHLDRLSDFGIEYDYDQRQARRYSDKGIREIARHVASEWTIEASPTLEVQLVVITATVLKAVIRAEWLPFIEMREPSVESVTAVGTRMGLPCQWHRQEADGVNRIVGHVVIEQDESLELASLSVLWHGEVWPRFVATAGDLGALQLTVQSLAARILVAAEAIA